MAESAILHGHANIGFQVSSLHVLCNTQLYNNVQYLARALATADCRARAPALKSIKSSRGAQYRGNRVKAERMLLQV
jgi:hypothetical protein